MTHFTPPFARLCTFLLLTSTFLTTLAAPDSKPIYKNPKYSIDERIADLLPRMTMEDKLGQVMQGDVSNWMNQEPPYAFNYTGLLANMEYKRGSFYVGFPVPWDVLAENIERGQKWLLENTTLGIPALVQTEGIHGFLIGNATIFPSPIGLGCAFDPKLVEDMAEVISIEAAALGVNNIFAPVVDLARELRFGRVEEMYSEDAYLSGEMGYSYVKGLQKSKKVAAMVKHFAAFGTPEQGINTAPVHGGEREMRRTYLPAFKRAIIDADAWSVMGAYHSYDGVPAAADHHLLTDILRTEWGYKYHVITDAGASDKLCFSHALCERGDFRAVTMLALPAGNDIEMGGGSFNYRAIPELIEDGTLDQEILDTAVSRVLRTKFAMGLFEKPILTAPKNMWKKLINTPKHKELARKIDRESIVLLENHNNILPLDMSKLKSIAVLGPMAHGFMNYGDYVVYRSQYRGITPFDGIKAAVGDNIEVNYAQGCERWSNDKSGFDEAIAAAEKSDVAIVVVGTWSRDQRELWQGFNATTGEHVDVHNLNLVGAQADLVREVLKTGKPTIVVFSSGKPITEPWISEEATALVQQFYPGEEGGNALADVLFGKYNPSGKLSVSFPRDIGTAPSYYDYQKGARDVSPGAVYSNGTMKFGHQFVLADPRPLYPFGYGLSYSQFEYTNVTLSHKNATATDTITATVKVKNTSRVDGTEVVQVYVTDRFASVVTPNKELKGFKKVKIPAGKEVAVKIPVQVGELGVWNLRGKYEVEKGEFIVAVGDSSESIRSQASFWV